MQTSGSWHKVFCFPDIFVEVCSMINVDIISTFSAPKKDCIFWAWWCLSPHLFGGAACTKSSSSFSNHPFSLIVMMYTFIAMRPEGERHLFSSTRTKHGIFQLDWLCWSRSLFWLYELRQYHKKREELLILTLKTSSPNNSLKHTHKSATKLSRTSRKFTFIIFTIFNLFTVETTLNY